MIKIIMSKFPKENSFYIYKDIEKNLDKKEKAFLIVPEQYTLESDMDFIDSIKYKSVMDAKVLSFSSLISYISQRLSLKKNENLNQVSKAILLTSVLDEIDNKLKLFSNKSFDIDFVNNLSDFFSNIKEYYFDDEFFGKINKNENLDPMTKLKFEEIKLIYDSYIKKLENSYIDKEDELEIIKDNIKYCDFFKNVNFYFDKFDFLSDLKIDFIKELIKIGAKVTISICLDWKYYENNIAGDMDIFDQAIRFVESLKNIDKIKIINLEKENELLDIKHLYENFEKYNPQIYQEKTKNINIVESISSTNEIENISLIIEKLIREGHRYSEISLVLANSDEYENLVKRIFARSEIPIFVDKTKKLSDNHILKTWLSMIRLVVFNFRKTDLEAFIRSNVIDFGENAYERILDFQNYIENRKIKGAMIFEDKYFVLDEKFYENDEKLKKEKEAELKNVNSIRKILIDLLYDLYKIRNEKIKANDLVKEIYKSFDKKIIKSGFNHYQENIRENRLEIFEENKQVWDKFLTNLEQIATILSDSPTKLKKIYKLIENSCKATSIGIIPPAIDQVLIGDFSRDRINDRKIKIFVGMTDIYFPGNNNSEMLISENEKTALENEGIDLKIYREKKDDKILLNLLRMFTSSQKIIFSYSLINKENDPMNRATSISDIINIFPNISYKKIAKSKFDFIKYSTDLLDLKAYQILWNIKNKEDTKKSEKEFVESYLKFKKDNIENYNYSKNSSYDLFIKGFTYSNDKNLLSSEISKKLYDKNKFSVSEIETYAKCPYKHFINYGLMAKENKNLDVDNLEIGNIVHYNMENISKKLIDMDLKEFDDEKLENLVKESFQKAVENSLDLERANDNKNKFILSNIYESTQKSSKKIINQIKEGNFKIDSVEEKYGKGQKYPEVYVDDKNYLEGRIDRIDKCDNLLRIIDYKTGSKEIKIYNLLNGLDLQLFVYMLAAKEKKSENLFPVASFYFPLKDEVKKLEKNYDKDEIKKIYDDKTKMNGLIIKIDEEILNLLDKNFDGKKSDIFKITRSKDNIFSLEEEKIVEKFIKKLISSYISEIKNGNIKLNPLRINQNSYECINCPYKSICKFDYTIDQDKFHDINKNISINDIKKEQSDE